MNYKHIPVLLNETIEQLNINKDGVYVDCTLGFGGHSKQILKKLDNGLVIAIDQDQEAIEFAKDNLKEYANKVIFVNDNYSNIDNILDNLGFDKIDGAIMDIGVSSYQIDNAKRGFSYMKDGFLDMRMDRSKEITAFDILNSYSEKELVRIFSEYGEEHKSKTIAKAIVKQREIEKIDTTYKLRELINKYYNSNENHPEKRIFQALRIEVNDELEVLKNSIEKIVDRLKINGRICIISFHSLEDKIVKEKFKELNRDCICPPDFPICVCGHKRKLKLVTRKPIIATKEELKNNSRSHSAKLRVGMRV
ncbi:MAG: 16S rRNA (cytosine(1402)-N(4))-methyltransferase RsmH [Tissierellia bacterium]|nr:16S rRNA (cytosine(1402)-N(4))-methyltransferase RsmH [Tissierellia bacterium]